MALPEDLFSEIQDFSNPNEFPSLSHNQFQTPFYIDENFDSFEHNSGSNERASSIGSYSDNASVNSSAEPNGSGAESSPQIKSEIMSSPLRSDPLPFPNHLIKSEPQDNLMAQKVFNNNNNNNNHHAVSMPSKTNQLRMELLHKPRLSHGVWERVEDQKSLRVSTRGKLLRLLIYANEDIFVCNGSEQTPYFLSLWTVDPRISEPVYSQQNFQIESQHSLNPHTLQVELRLTQTKSSLQFYGEVQNREKTKIWSGQSFTFITHNSGSKKKPKKEEKEGPAVPKQKKQTKTQQKCQEPKQEQQKLQQIQYQQQEEQQKLQQSQYQPLPKPQEHLIGQSDDFIPKKKRPATEKEEDQEYDIIDKNLRVNGIVKAFSFQQWSDLRLKTDVVEIIDAMEIVSQLHGKKYKWKPDQVEKYNLNPDLGENQTIGLIAQEVRAVLPDVVDEDPETGILSIQYIQILPVLIEAFNQFVIKSQREKEETKKELEHIQNQISEISHALYDSPRNNENLPKTLQRIRELSQNSRPVFNPTTNLQCFSIDIWKVSTAINSALLLFAVVLAFVGIILLIESLQSSQDFLGNGFALLLFSAILFAISGCGLFSTFCLCRPQRGKLPSLGTLP